MPPTILEIILIFVLILLNGYFALSEIALISARRSYLRSLAKRGDKKAALALGLVRKSSEVLSTIQIGITLIGIFAGAFGGATVADHLEDYLNGIPWLAGYGEPIGVALVVIIITYFSLVIGELVPKQIALSHPEKIALSVARPINALLKILSPFVKILSRSTIFLLKMLHIKQSEEHTVTEEEIKLLIAEGAERGVFEKSEQKIVERVFNLGNRPISDFMTPHQEIVWLDVTDSFDVIKKKITDSDRSVFPVCSGNLNQYLGIVETKDMLFHFFNKGSTDPDLRALVQPVGTIESSIPALVAIERLKQSAVNIAVIVDEQKTVLGIITFHDILEAIVGALKSRW